MEFPTKEVLVSKSHLGVLRGLHYTPYRKQIYIVSGQIYDFWYVPKTGECFEGVLSAGDSMVIPHNAMHGFYALSEVEMLYFLEDNYNPEFDKTYHWQSPGTPFVYNFPQSNIIISKADDQAPFYQQADYLLLGATGYLGSYTEKVLVDQGKKYIATAERLENLASIEKLIVKGGVKYVLCAAGISGRPTTQWCEDHEKETYQVNYLQMLNLMELTDRLKVHLTIYGTGLLYNLTGSGKTVFDESDKPNLDNSVYVRLRVELESRLRLYPNVLCLRILYPTTADNHPKCFLTKMAGRTSSVHNVDVAVTVVPDLFPQIPALVEAGVTGPLNFVNSGVISLPDFLKTFRIEHTVTNPEPRKGVELSTEHLSKVSHRETPVVQSALCKLAARYNAAQSA
ncbi:hypothetical protein HK103_006830 [Boothiomyces macroporosus]|uniref:NAD-dependent epimerase/dehydratase domain-containing protein n=1 Tax=Boothiomyces macroporosus TaxID=261099 RepID=A0AAD5UG65_9FUNG|nr:hypothetical protein HK103_006830 [Boothiomyces macroporosus]